MARTFHLCCSLSIVLFFSVVFAMLGSISNSAAIFFPCSYPSFQTDGSPLSALMIFISTLASWAASMISALFPYNIVDKATVLERPCSAAHRAINNKIKLLDRAQVASCLSFAILGQGLKRLNCDWERCTEGKEIINPTHPSCLAQSVQKQITPKLVL